MHKHKIYFIIVLQIIIIECANPPVVNRNTTKSNVNDKETNVRVNTTLSNVKKKIKTLGNQKKSKSNVVRPTSGRTVNNGPKMITPETIQQWAKKLSEQFYETEEHVVLRNVLIKSFSDMRSEVRNGTAIVNQMAENIEDLMIKRSKAAEKIMRKAEEFAKSMKDVSMDYRFDYSVDLDELKPTLEPFTVDDLEIPNWCRSLKKVKLDKSKHFDADVSLDASSVYVSAEVFDCDPRVLPHIQWTEKLLSTFKENYAEDATTAFQYFCSASGFLRHYPAARWNMFKLEFDPEEVGDVYDCRLRPWYVSAGGAPRDILILLDASGSMHNSSNKIKAEQFTSTLLNSLTDDDQVNVLRFNVVIESPISCFNEKLVSANHVNTAAMMAAMKGYKMTNETKMEKVLEYAVRMLQMQQVDMERPAPCQQAIVLLTDSIYGNFSELLQLLDPEGNIRLFIFWLHDPFGLRDDTRKLSDWMCCDRDGYFAELITDSDVTEQVMRVLRVLERPLVVQRDERITVFSDVYAHVEDPRRGEYHWTQKERVEQEYRYKELRKNKENLLNRSRLQKDYDHQLGLDLRGEYYEGEDVNYRLQISISVPVFDYVTSENITKVLEEQKQRKSTRTYPVNRLLGVAGVDIPIDHLKLILPYHELGAGGSLFLLDHRGNIVLHDNLRPTFDGDILKPGYRTVDMIDLEQPAIEHIPRHYPREWLEFRKEVIIDKEHGNRSVYAKYVIEAGMRMYLEMRDYYWRRVLDHYTAVVVLPKYNRQHVGADTVFTQKLAEDALKTLSDNPDFSVNPDWLYCRHIEPYFDSREHEIQHFLRRRRDEPNFPMKKLEHYFTPIRPTLFEKTYHCNEKLMAQFSKESILTEAWVAEQEKQADKECLACQLGAVTSFFASESGLTRWRQYYPLGAIAIPPDALVWPKGPNEGFYQRSVIAAGDLVVNAYVHAGSRLRNSFMEPPKIGMRSIWLTAARSLSNAKGTIGVAGYHFHPHHLDEVVKIITNHPTDCDDEEEDCPLQCDGEDWSCVLVDDAGWILSKGEPGDEEEYEKPRQHLATVHPAAMAALLNANVFKLHWLHDYQAVCYTFDKVKGSATTLTSLMSSLWRSLNILFVALHQLITTVIVFSVSNPLVYADTEFEKEKRRRRLKKDYERETYERLYDNKVLVNRSRFAACDRSRTLYILQRTSSTIEALKRPAHACSWPLVGALVPKTNLLLLAIYNPCPHTGRPVPDPMVNEPVQMTEDDTESRPTTPGDLACWRHRVPLPGRPPRTKCFKHNYKDEHGYRQCGPWIPDPE